MSHQLGWTGVDLDGTLAMYDGWRGIQHIGEPIPQMVDNVKRLLASGRTVKIFTARVHDKEQREEVVKVIQDWCVKHIGEALEVTNEKDFAMIDLWDDRCMQVIPNTGKFLAEMIKEEP